jgi:hypothetical protein
MDHPTDNGMFPRIDTMLQSLFALLKVNELEDIVPSVRQLALSQR